MDIFVGEIIWNIHTKYPYHQTYYRQESQFYNRYTIFAHQMAVYANQSLGVTTQTT